MITSLTRNHTLYTLRDAKRTSYSQFITIQVEVKTYKAYGISGFQKDTFILNNTFVSKMSSSNDNNSSATTNIATPSIVTPPITTLPIATTPIMASTPATRKMAIVTGCASGIGLLSAKIFLDHGYVVFGVDINPMDYLSFEGETQERFHFHQGNLADEGKCDEIVTLCVEKYE
jgi:hypothetical protein